MKYAEFLEGKMQLRADSGFDPIWIPDFLFDFQKSLVEWAILQGHGAIFADCGLGKTPMQLVWAENVVRHTGRPVLILTPLAVSAQTVREGEKFGIDCVQSRDGIIPNGAKIIITNYDRLHYFKATDFSGVVCDESSILKHFGGATQKQVTRFICKLPYRLLCTATAAPNDYIELGTSSEALGGLSYSDMLTRFFRQFDNKGQDRELRQQAEAERTSKHFARLSFRVSQTIGQWRLKHHAKDYFWKWVCSWARACRMPSDLGFDDGDFLLPELHENEHIIKPDTLPSGMLFSVPAFGLKEEREERKRTLTQRCKYAASLVSHSDPAIIWCHYNAEGDALENMITDSAQVKGATPDDEKERIYEAFLNGDIRVLITKPKIGAWGLNWQHCARVVSFASHSYEQYYQSIRRCWRFGQKNPVRVDIIATEGERRVIDNMKRKSSQADVMFSMMIEHMQDAQTIKRTETTEKEIGVPSWIK